MEGCLLTWKLWIKLEDLTDFRTYLMKVRFAICCGQTLMIIKKVNIIFIKTFLKKKN